MNERTSLEINFNSCVLNYSHVDFAESRGIIIYISHVEIQKNF